MGHYISPPDLGDSLDAMAERIRLLEVRVCAADAWHAPTLTGGWSNFGGSYELAGYRFDGPSHVVFKGSVTGGTSGTNLFTLPAAYRPAADRRMSTVCTDNSGNTYPAMIGATPAGTVFSYCPTGPVGAIEEFHLEVGFWL
jgi:hypothetical protein